MKAEAVTAALALILITSCEDPVNSGQTAPIDINKITGKWVRVETYESGSDEDGPYEICDKYDPRSDNFKSALIAEIRADGYQYDYQRNELYDTYNTEKYTVKEYTYRVKGNAVFQTETAYPNEDPWLWGVVTFSGDTLILTDDNREEQYIDREKYIPYTGNIPHGSWLK